MIFTTYFWRKLHCKMKMRQLYTNSWDTRAFWDLGTGYCIDRYSLD